ncbi:MAG: cyclic nucleotide-binding domain-containing protein [Hyphomicrobiaceae bacterium]
MSWAEILGYFGASLTITVYSMKRMIPLRIIGIGANCVFIVYGFVAAVYPQMILHSVLLPINVYRLYEMLLLIRKVKGASQGDLNMDWLKPYMKRRTAKQGEALFRKGDVSSDMFYTLTGRYRLNEIGLDLEPGQVVGEIGLIAPDNKRTLTLECIEDGDLLTISYDHVKELYFQNPEFGFYFLQLVSKRLFTDIERLQERTTRPA